MDTQTFLQADLLQVVTTGRLWSIVAGLLGLTGLIIGIVALMRVSRNVNSAQRIGTIALVLASAGILLSIIHLARTTGGFGTGKGRAGAIVAIVIGLIGIIFSRLAITRSRRIAKRNTSG
ncbi:MAG TPA: DUF6223 family protein [Chitinophagaceae bacterium]|nr:DUF6223 family protein [Chitinophagaceae bacterium]